MDNIAIVNPSYPTYATRDIYQHSGYDFLILVEDVLAKYILEVNMKNSQSKFSNEKSQSSSSSKPSSSSSSSSGCCCGSNLSDEIDEVEISEMEEK